jgi:formylmethanofuran dehydrogenase subunit A
MTGGRRVKYKSAPQVFHDKEEKPKYFVMYPTELFIAINNLCTGNESKVLLTLLGCKGDGTFSPSTQYMLNMTGISKSNHFHTVRQNLTKKQYIEENDGDIYVNTTKILEEYSKKTSQCTAKPDPNFGGVAE